MSKSDKNAQGHLLGLEQLESLCRKIAAIGPYASVVTDSEGAIRERGVHLEIAEDLPTVLVDGARIVQVFQNLLENSCKYMGDQARPRIEIVASRENGATSVVFKDNGIGIAPAYHDRVFGFFDKLDLATEGSGIGLALVKRIIEFHQGRIWIESDGQGHGTAFHFTLPTASPI